MDKVPFRPTSRRGRPLQRRWSKDAASAPPTPSQPSQKPSLTTPSSTPSKSARKSRTKRKTRSQASREQSPVTQIVVAAETACAELVAEVDEVTTNVVTTGVRKLTMPELPSLRSEVPETAEAPAASLEQNYLVADAPTPLNSRAAEVVDAVEPQHHLAEPGSVQPAASTTAPVQNQETGAQFDLARKLEDILEHLNTVDSSAMGSKFDLATVHSLCFKIGLKAQELAMSQH